MFAFLDVAQASVGLAFSVGLGALIYPFGSY
jgi:hypothetical protein